MNSRRQKLIETNTKYHMVIHLVIGVFIAIFVHRLFPFSSFSKTLVLSLFGSWLPDIDHFIFFYIYGRNNEYSKIVRAFLRQFRLKEFASFAQNNHKELTGLYSHNLASTFIAALIFFVLALDVHGYKSVTFALAITMHFIYDIVEDLLARAVRHGRRLSR